MVAWFMYSNGLRPRTTNAVRAPYTRKNGRTVWPFDAAEDAFIVKQSIDGLSHRQIAAKVATVFGHPRGAHAVKVRLIMLAGFEAEAEERAECCPTSRIAA